MTEMVERVARAMKKRASQPLANIPSLEPVLVGSLSDAWDCLAEAAIAAMREPADAMMDVGQRLDRNAYEIYVAMIDAGGVSV